MLPQQFIVLKHLPVMSNGKIDKNALPEPKKQHLLDKIHALPHTKIENDLAIIWRKCLKIKKIGINDNFFELGGHSLIAIEMFSLIQNKYSLNLSLRTLFEAPTIALLSNIVDKEINNFKKKITTNIDKKSFTPKLVLSSEQSIPSPIIELNRGVYNKSPIFFIHPIGGTVFCFLSILKYLKTNHPIYALQDPCIESGQYHFLTLEEMANFYMHSIQLIQPNGPYLLAGSSSGATIAIEIARQLEVQGHKINFLGLLDGWAYYPENLNDRQFFEENLRKQHKDWHQEFTQKGIYDPTVLFNTQWQRSILLREYKIQSIDSPLTLFKAQELLDYFKPIQAKYNHWDRFANQPINVLITSGNHDTMYQEPNVQYLSNLFNKCLLSINS